MTHSDSESDEDWDTLGDGLLGDPTDTVQDFAQRLAALSRTAVGMRESFIGGDLQERRSMMEASLGSDFVQQLRGADDWLYEAMLILGDDEDAAFDDPVCNKRVAYCAHAAVMTHDCHGTLWPHLRFQTQSYDQAMELSVGMVAKCDAAAAQLETANKDLGIDGWDVRPPRRTGTVDLGTLELQCDSGAVGLGSLMRADDGLKGSLLHRGVPALIFVEQKDERVGVLLQLRCLRKDSTGGVILELLFVVHHRETFHAPGSLHKLTLEALMQEHDGQPPLKVTCTPKELEALITELRSNSAELSAACHMRVRESFAGKSRGEEAVGARVVREPLELSYLQVRSPPSHAMQEGLEKKQQGNQKVGAGEVAEALDLYKDALTSFAACSEQSRVQEETGKVYANMAECYLRQERWADVISAASRALELDSSNMKATFRRAKAYEALGRMTDALKDARAAARLEPKNPEVRSFLQRLAPPSGASTPPPQHNNHLAAGDAATPPRATRPPSSSSQQASCHGFAAAVNDERSATKSHSSWALGLSPAMQHEWLVDCYRLRVDDQYAWGGGDLRGLYLASAGGGSRHEVANDFLLFCKLAVQQDVVPRAWDWPAFLEVAKGLLHYAFEKEDAKEKYGQENVFAVAMGGRSLRYTAEIVYGSSIMGMEASEAETHMEEEVRSRRFQDHFYANVGGAEVWREAGMAPLHAWTRQKGAGKGKASQKGRKGKHK